ncbi:unnamed protein product [Cylicocyclus nassatus]|uniref:Cytoplasmic polyadenylation element-binding protein 1 n=3 Tax=Strongyloidea TaxID=27829 RepID=A0AA36HD95_CYLNA|nr:unnamed protein product [Cylicocyclus nassatus]
MYVYIQVFSQINCNLKSMSKRGFLDLDDDNFWGNDDSKADLTSEQEEREEEATLPDLEKDAENLDEHEEDTEGASKVDLDGWEDVGELKKNLDAKIESGNPFQENSPFGGFSRTNAATYYQDEHSKRPDRQTQRRSHEQNHGNAQAGNKSYSVTIDADHADAHIEGTSRKDRKETEMAVAANGSRALVPLGNRRSKDRKNAAKREEDEDEKETWEKDLSSPSGSKSSVAEQSGDGPRIGWNNNERTDLNMIDEQYVEYYEYLCQGIQKLLESGITLNSDCESRSSTSSFQQPTICRALKSKYYRQYNLGPEIYSRKVFVGGLPIDIEEDELVETFARFGPLVVDWPNKNETKSYYPPKGYVFLIFNHETSVRTLVQHCTIEDEKLFLFISSSMNAEKLKVQIRPWRLADADYLVDVNVPINLRRVVFVGGVPRPIRAVELAHIMDRLYGSVACAGIDTDVEYKYPKGAGRVAFTNYNSYMRAITERYAQLSHGEVEKRVEMKPYVLDDQICEECIREPNGGRHAPFFCPHLECLQYYCESCWTSMHGSPSREHHKPLVKEA